MYLATDQLCMQSLHVHSIIVRNQVKPVFPQVKKMGIDIRMIQGNALGLFLRVKFELGASILYVGLKRIYTN